MDTFFIAQTVHEHLDGSFASIHKNPDLVPQDIPILESKVALLHALVAERKVACAQDQQSKISADRQEFDAALAGQEAVATLQTNNVDEKSRSAPEEVGSSKLADMAKNQVKTTKKFLTEKEAAGYLKIHQISLKRMRLAGKGPRYVPLGPRQIRYEEIDLDHFTDQLKNGGQDAKTA